jgi:hypothetical protein
MIPGFRSSDHLETSDHLGSQSSSAPSSSIRADADYVTFDREIFLTIAAVFSGWFTRVATSA